MEVKGGDKIGLEYARRHACVVDTIARILNLARY
jgi:hypothetical protein